MYAHRNNHAMGDISFIQSFLTSSIDTNLSLKHVGGHNLTPVTVEERERSAESWRGDTPKDSLCNNAPPPWLRLGNGYVIKLSTNFALNCMQHTLVEEVVE